MKILVPLVLTLLCAHAVAFAQCEYGSTKVELFPKDRKYKIKAVLGVSSATARVADYVEFKTLENIYVLEDEVRGENKVKVVKVLFAKDTPIFGVVTRRKHRHFPFVGGKIEIELEPLQNWDGNLIQLAVYRREPFKESSLKTKEDTKEINQACKDKRDGCVAGRRNASVAPIVPAVATAASGVVAAVAKDDETRFIAATAFFTIAKEVGNLLNGTDAEIAKDEVFDMKLRLNGVNLCRLP